MNSLFTKLKLFRRKLDIFNGQQRILDNIKDLKKEINIMKSYEKEIINRLYKLQYHQIFMENDRINILYKHVKTIHDLLLLKNVKGYHLIRIGNKYDGGYLMIDDFSSDMIAYSFGISNDVSWEQDIANLGIHCFMYDHTISRLPKKYKLFHWHKTGICGDEPVKDCRPLSEFIKINGHEGNNNLILKMDIESSEWDVMEAVNRENLLQFKQIIFELHDMCSEYKYECICNVLKKINETHQVVHIHGNNYVDYTLIGDIVMPHCLEILYIRKNDYDFIDNNNFYPLAQDKPNNPSQPDITLGIWNNM